MKWLFTVGLPLQVVFVRGWGLQRLCIRPQSLEQRVYIDCMHIHIYRTYNIYIYSYCVYIYIHDAHVYVCIYQIPYPLKYRVYIYIHNIYILIWISCIYIWYDMQKHIHNTMRQSVPVDLQLIVLPGDVYGSGRRVSGWTLRMESQAWPCTLW